MKLWIDDLRPAPDGYVWCGTVNVAKQTILAAEKGMLTIVDDNHNVVEAKHQVAITLIDIDHDAGDYAYDGGDYIKLLDWLEETGRDYPIRIHSGNVVGVINMRRIIQRNGWKEVF